MSIDPTAHPAPQAWTLENPPPGSPQYALIQQGATPEARRIYFEKLTGILLSSGLSGERVGELVAELDDHVAMSGLDPVTELGPVGEMATALLDATEGASPWRVVGIQALMGVAVGSAFAAFSGLLLGRGDDGSVTFDVAGVVSITMVIVAMAVTQWKGTKNLVGRTTFEWPALKWMAIVFAPYLVFTLVMETVAPEFSADISEWSIPTGSAVATVIIGTIATAGLFRYYLQLGRVPVPGSARHLRRLQWGMWGR